MPQSIMANIMDGKWKTLENTPQALKAGLIPSAEETREKLKAS
jgi:hypothetical protein